MSQTKGQTNAHVGPLRSCCFGRDLLLHLNVGYSPSPADMKFLTYSPTLPITGSAAQESQCGSETRADLDKVTRGLLPATFQQQYQQQISPANALPEYWEKLPKTHTRLPPFPSLSAKLSPPSPALSSSERTTPYFFSVAKISLRASIPEGCFHHT